jgi:hypothetical protein
MESKKQRTATDAPTGADRIQALRAWGKTAAASFLPAVVLLTAWMGAASCERGTPVDNKAPETHLALDTIAQLLNLEIKEYSTF